MQIDGRLVARLIREQFPRWASLPVAPVPAGSTDNAMFRLGADLVVRLPRLPSSVPSVDTEQRWLPRLAPLLPIAVPAPVGKGVPDDEYPYPWSVYQWLAGENAVERPVTELSEAAELLGRFVAALRRCDATGAPRSVRAEPVSLRDDDVIRTRIRALAADGTVDPAAATAVWEAALAAPAWDGAPVWTHGDLHPGNLLVRDGRLAAVIDFGLLGAGDPAADMLPAWTLLTARTRDRFRAAAGVDDATWARGRGWALGAGLGAVHVYRDTNPVLGAIGQHALTETLLESGEAR